MLPWAGDMALGESSSWGGTVGPQQAMLTLTLQGSYRCASTPLSAFFLGSPGLVLGQLPNILNFLIYWGALWCVHISL